MNMIMWLARLFMVWVAIIFHVASANEEILYGWQQPVEASKGAASTTTTPAFPPVERESRTAENALNTRPKRARLETDQSDDDLLTIGLGTGGAYYPSYPSSYGQSSRSEVISVLTKKHNHLANNHETFQFMSKNPQLFPSGVSLEQVHSQASSASTTRSRDFLSDFDKTRETDASASTKHYVPSPTNRPESLSDSFNLGRKTQLQVDAPITRGPLENSVTHEQDGGRGTKRKIWTSWGTLLSLKTGVTSDENDVQHGYATPDLLSGFPSVQLNRFSGKENHIATPQFNPQEIQQAIRIFQRGSNTPSYHNAGASMVPVLSAGGNIPWEMSSMGGQNGGNVLLSLKPPEQGENGREADQIKKSSLTSRPQHSPRAEQTILVDWPRSTEILLNQSPRPHHNIVESQNQGSSSEDAENSPQVPKMPNPHQLEAIANVGKHASQNDFIKNYGRIKFHSALLKAEGAHRLTKSDFRILNSIPRPSPGNILFTDNQLGVACENLKRRHSQCTQKLSMHEIVIFMGNIERWYQYWNVHANIDLKSLNKGSSKSQFVLPLFLLYVEMIISIIPFKKGLPSNEELNYPQEMRYAIESYLDFKTLMRNPPENENSKIWKEKWNSFKRSKYNTYTEPSGILWKFIEFWMQSHYTSVWNNLKEREGLHVSRDVKRFFNSIFAHGIETLNENLGNSLPKK